MATDFACNVSLWHLKSFDLSLWKYSAALMAGVVGEFSIKGENSFLL